MNNGNVKNFPPRPAPQPQQITFNVEGQEPMACSCGCVYFETVIMVYKVSALVSPTGKELIAQRPVLICSECRVLLDTAAMP